MKRLMIAMAAACMVFAGTINTTAGCCKAEAAKNTSQCPMSKAVSQCPADKTECTEKMEANCPMKGQKGCPKEQASTQASAKKGCCAAKNAQRKQAKVSVKGAEHLNTL